MIQKALLDAKEQGSLIWQATYGVMFMAVPHQGSPGADYATLLTHIAKVTTPINAKALNQLKTHSADLQELSIRFGSIQRDLHIVSVLEADATLLLSRFGRGSVLVIFIFLRHCLVLSAYYVYRLFPHNRPDLISEKRYIVSLVPTIELSASSQMTKTLNFSRSLRAYNR